MKKMTGKFLAAIFVVMGFASSAFSGGSIDWNELVWVKQTISATGDFQQYVRHPFEVTGGNCGELETYQLQHSFPLLGVQAEWKKMDIGATAQQGWYRFKNPKTACSSEFQLIGQVSRWVAEGASWQTMEVESEDLDLLSKSEEENFFNLSQDDAKFSYELVIPPIGAVASLDEIANGSLFYVPSNRVLVGAIISNDRGFLHKKAMWDDSWLSHDWGRFHFLDPVPSDAKNIIIRSGETIAIIWAEMK